MKHFWKKILIGGLGLSNIAVLGLVFYTYLDNNQPLNLFSVSSSESVSFVEQKIKRDCKALQKLEKSVEDGGKREVVCSVSVTRRWKGNRVVTRHKFRVEKKQEGEGFNIVGVKTVTSVPRKYRDTEANFCNNCKTQKEVESFEEIMQTLVAVNEEMYGDTTTSLKEAQGELNRKERAERMGKLKQERCEGIYDEDSGEFEQFEVEEKLECKMTKMDRLDPVRRESFYHRHFKRDLWRLALGEDSDTLYDSDLLFQLMHDENLGIRSSAQLINVYPSWRNKYDNLDDYGRQRFIDYIVSEANGLRRTMSQNQAKTDLVYLNKGFDNALTRLNAATRPATRSTYPKGSRQRAQSLF